MSHHPAVDAAAVGSAAVHAAVVDADPASAAQESKRTAAPPAPSVIKTPAAWLQRQISRLSPRKKLAAFKRDFRHALKEPQTHTDVDGYNWCDMCGRVYEEDTAPTLLRKHELKGVNPGMLIETVPLVLYYCAHNTDCIHLASDHVAWHYLTERRVPFGDKHPLHDFVVAAEKLRVQTGWVVRTGWKPTGFLVLAADGELCMTVTAPEEDGKSTATMTTSRPDAATIIVPLTHVLRDNPEIVIDKWLVEDCKGDAAMLRDRLSLSNLPKQIPLRGSGSVDDRCRIAFEDGITEFAGAIVTACRKKEKKNKAAPAAGRLLSPLS